MKITGKPGVHSGDVLIYQDDGTATSCPHNRDRDQTTGTSVCNRNILISVDVKDVVRFINVSVAEKIRGKEFFVYEVEVYAGKIQCLYVYSFLHVYNIVVPLRKQKIIL